MAKKRQQPTAAELRRDAFDAMTRKCLGLIGLYQEMMESFLAADSFDEELATRMLAIRETCLMLIESAMPVPVSAGQVKDIETLSRARH